jgi:hypothetical protein
MGSSALAPVRLGVHARPQKTAVKWTGVLAVASAIGAGVVGLYGRLWLIFHAPFTSDSSIVGLIAQGALHGHFTAFYSGQVYGGTAEDYVVALGFLIFGQSGVVAELVVTVLTALAAILTQRIALRLAVPYNLAILAGALVWAAPAVAIRDSMRVSGFRAVTLVCGLGLVLIALRMLDGDLRMANFAGIGLLFGVGWWSSPEIAYYALPALLLIVGAAVLSSHLRQWLPGCLLALGLAIVAALPWIWANLGSRFASIRPTPISSIPYGGRFSLFFHYSLPLETNLLRADHGARILHQVYTPALIVVIATIVVALVLCLAAGGRATVIGIAVVVFPFLYAISPASGAWKDGRYAGYLVPLLALVFAVGSCEAARRFRGPRSLSTLLMSGVVIVSSVLSVVGLVELVGSESSGFTARWGDPDSSTIAAISKLEEGGVTTGYADYWVAYKLDFFSKGRLNITTAGYDDVRSVTIGEVVERSTRPAWLFVPPDKGTEDGTQFTDRWLAVGPDAGMVTEARFLNTLHSLGVGYRIVNAGIVLAVVPDETVTPYEAKIPGALPLATNTAG